MTFLAYPPRFLKRTDKVLVLLGDQGIGKSMILVFMCMFVYGKNLLFSCVGLDSITQRFNAAIAGKMLFTINEMDAADNQTQYLAKFNKYITGERVQIERKGIDAEMIDNYCNYVICSNSDYPVHIDDHDRRYAIFRCSDRFRGREIYFNNLSTLFTQESGNLFSDYMLPLLVSLNDIPKTETKLDIIELSLPKTIFFGKEFFLNGEENINEGYIHIINNRPFITTKDLYNVYKEWYRENHPAGKPKGEATFSKDLKSKCPSLEYADRQTIRGEGRKRGFFINESAYDSCKIIRVTGDTKYSFPLRQLLTPTQSNTTDSKLITWNQKVINEIKKPESIFEQAKRLGTIKQHDDAPSKEVAAVAYDEEVKE